MGDGGPCSWFVMQQMGRGDTVISTTHPSTYKWILKKMNAHVLLWFLGALQSRQKAIL